MTGSRCIQHFRSRARRAQPVAAGAEERAGGGSSAAATPASSTATEPVREVVTFVQYDGTPVCVEQLTQGKLDFLLGRYGARGFFTADGSRSRAVSRLPEGGPVRLSYRWEEHAVSQGPTEQELEPLKAFVRCVACEENDNFVIPLRAGPFEYPDGDEYMSMDFAFVAGGTVYVGHYQRELDETGVLDMYFTHLALGRRHASPELADALEGVTAVKLFLGGDHVRAGLTVQAFVEKAAKRGISVVLPADNGLDVAGRAAPAMPL
ncbi:hypothetical protein ABPG77_006164 [Micractinium sp. CCAP 211/92]